MRLISIGEGGQNNVDRILFHCLRQRNNISTLHQPLYLLGKPVSQNKSQIQKML